MDKSKKGLYNRHMDTKSLIAKRTDKIWNDFCESYPKLVWYNPPKIVLCNRLTKTAGKCYQEESVIHLANKFFANNMANMIRVILPHELAHAADWDLFGESEKNCGHGKKWAEIMVNYGLAAKKYHSMEL